MWGRRCLVAAAVAMAAFFGARSDGAAAEWQVDAAASRIGFVATQMRVPARGAFERFSAAIRFDPADLGSSAVEILIEVASVRTAMADIDREVVRPKWFDAARFPQARFAARRFRAAGPGRFEAIGTLTLRDVTQDVILPFTLTIGPDPARAGHERAHAAGKLTVQRTAFGIGRDEWRDTAVVADEVVIEIDVVARRPR